MDNGDVLILFPEGSRGRPEQMSKLKKGIFYIIEGRSDVQVTPVKMHGLGRALPRGEALFVPFNCDVVIGDEIPVTDNAAQFIAAISRAFDDLSGYCLTRSHEEG